MCGPTEECVHVTEVYTACSGCPFRMLSSKNFVCYFLASLVAGTRVVSSCKESCNNKQTYGNMLPTLTPSPNLHVKSV